MRKTLPALGGEVRVGDGDRDEGEVEVEVEEGKGEEVFGGLMDLR